MRILSMIPKQIGDDFDAKLKWLGDIFIKAKKERVDVILTTQEFLGGDYMMPSRPAFREKELLPILEEMSKANNVALIIGLIEEEGGKRYERLWFIDKELKGKLTKLFEPAYTVIGAGSYGLTPEVDFFNRFKTFELKGANFTGFFCWEIFSDFLMMGLGLLEPDFVVSAIKFGANAYPKNVKNADGLKEVKEIKYTSGREIWYERLKMASEFELKAPIICSTNSWNLKAKSRPMCGILYPYLGYDLVKVTDDMLKDDIISIDQIDHNKVRGLREHKFSYLKRVGEFPDWKMAVYTMLMKIHRWEQRLFATMPITDLDRRVSILYSKKRKSDKLPAGQQTFF